MKPIKLELQAFGPFVENQVVDFEKLSKSGIFLIKGKTGSGKTTIFDAMTFALYGGGSGTNEKTGNGRNDIKEWRCTQADEKTETRVSFTFSVQDKTYVFTRRLSLRRTNFTEKYEAGMLDEDGKVLPFFENPKKADLMKKAEELIGLTKEQFRQVVLLPQGQFERFLTAPSDAKEEILTKIFNDERWDKYARKFFEAAYARKSALDEEKRSIDIRLAGEELESLEALDEAVRSAQAQLEERKAEHQAFDADNKQKQLSADIALAEKFASLHKLESRKAALELQADGMRQNKLAYERAEEAESFRTDIEEFEKAQDNLKKREKALKDLQSKLPESEAAASDAKAKKAAHEENSPVEELQKKIGEYESKRPVYDAFSTLEKQYADACSACAAAKETLDEATEALETAAKTAGSLYDKHRAEEQLAQDFRDRYFKGIYGELAASLQEGKACPVCGSVEHPQPAEKTPDSVTEPQMKAQEKAAKAAREKWEKAETGRKQAEDEKSSGENIFREKETAKTKAESELASARASLIKGIADVKALDKAIAACNERVSAYNAEAQELAAAAETAEGALKELQGRISAGEKERKVAEGKCAETRAKLAAALTAHGYENYLDVKERLLPAKERTEMHAKIVNYDTDCKSVQKDIDQWREALRDQAEPDRKKFDGRQAEIAEENNTFLTESASLNGKIRRLCALGDELKKNDEHYRSEICQAESDLAFARKLRGDSGIGLQRYVLAIMFNQVIAEANRMLLQVHGGRYQLFRSDDKGSGNKRGLELRVHDSRSPGDEHGRSVAMLSGGEKFLVSLALSIGLSTVAQKSGVQIDALFIDEGFGTLDEDSVEDAMKILESVRKGNGTIGIISHIELLERTILTQLEVIKSESGNHIRSV